MQCKVYIELKIKLGVEVHICNPSARSVRLGLNFKANPHDILTLDSISVRGRLLTQDGPYSAGVSWMVEFTGHVPP